jgi:hypothetical protein
MVDAIKKVNLHEKSEEHANPDDDPITNTFIESLGYHPS